MEDPGLLELVELSNGDIALRRADQNDEDAMTSDVKAKKPAALVKIRFSDESEFSLDAVKMTVARAMIEAGIEAYAELQAEAAIELEAPENPILH